MQNKEKLLNSLINKGYTKEQINSSFESVKKYRPNDMPKEIERKAKLRVEEMMNKKSILSYILKETLVIMLEKWTKEDYGQLYKTNSPIYIEACTKFIEDLKKVIE